MVRLKEYGSRSRVTSYFQYGAGVLRPPVGDWRPASKPVAAAALLTRYQGL